MGSQRGIRAAGVAALAALALGVVATGSWAGRSVDRATVDRPDDITGPQVHVAYVVPSDGNDRGLDVDGTLAASVANWEGWLRGQTGGRGLRLDTAGGAVDITFLRLSESDAEVTATGAQVRDTIEHELIAKGLVKPDKIYAVYYDGNSTYACGGGAWPPALPGIVGAVYLPPTFWNSSGTPCYDPRQSLSGMQLMDFAIVHELFHTLGFVPSCAPHFTQAGHVSDSPTDLMYAGSEPWVPSVLDYGHDDYFDAHVPGCPDFSASPFLEGNEPVELRVAVTARTGRGSVTSTPAGISCPGVCAGSFPHGSAVVLVAAPARGSRFVTWGGSCAGAVRTCRVSLDRATDVTARFAALPKCKPGHRSSRLHPCRR